MFEPACALASAGPKALALRISGTASVPAIQKLNCKSKDLSTSAEPNCLPSAQLSHPAQTRHGSTNHAVVFAAIACCLRNIYTTGKLAQSHAIDLDTQSGFALVPTEEWSRTLRSSRHV